MSGLKDEQVLALLREIREVASRSNKPMVFTQEMAAEQLSVSMTKLRELIRANEIQTVRLGGRGHPMITRRELERALARWSGQAEPVPSTTLPRPKPPRPQKAPGYNTKAEVEKARARLKALKKKR